MIEENYFSQGNLEVQPGEYRQTTVEVGSFEANTLPLTARNQVNRIITEMAVLDVAESGLVLREINPVYTVAEVIAATGIRLFYLHVHYE